MLEIEESSTIIKRDLNAEIKMTGEERYKIVGNGITNQEMEEIMTACKGLSLYGDCIEKNQIAQKILKQKTVLLVGEIQISYNDALNYTHYGFLYNPPLEFHAFLADLNNLQIIDVALPGVILRGQQMRDDKGYFLEGLKPFIIAGQRDETLPCRLIYRPCRILGGI